MEFIQTPSIPITSTNQYKSTIQWYGEHTTDTCGYCPKDDNGIHITKPHATSHGFVSKNMYSNDYDSLLNCGWRRCGDYYYKNVLHKVCFILFYFILFVYFVY